MKSNQRLNRKEAGQVLALTAVFMLMIIPTMGLAIDTAVLYNLKAKLSTAADAAAIAAARNLNVGLTMAEQETAAANRAYAYFDANFPTGNYRTFNRTRVVGVAETGYRTRTVTVTAAIDAPSYFMRILGYNSTHIVAEGKASRRDVNLMLVLDRSGSMNNGTTPSACQSMVAASQNFVNMFAESRDRLGAIAFSSGYIQFFNPSMTFKTGGSASLPGKLATMNCSGGTSTALALHWAYESLKTTNEPGALNLIVLFTDGYPNAINAAFPIKRKTDTRYGYSGGPTGCTSTSYTCSMEPSPCKDPSGNLYDRNAGQSTRTYFAPTWNPNWFSGVPNPTLTGVFTQAAGDQYHLPTGSTVGLIDPATDAVNQTYEELASLPYASCAMFYSGTSTTNWAAARRDLAYIPDQDIYGNSTSGYRAVGTYSSGEYSGQKRTDCPMCATGAGFNAADNQATTIRNDATYNIVIYTIGLGSNGGVDGTFLARVANDPASPIYNPNRPTGMYAYAPNASDLNFAFQRIASEILRIAR